MNIKSGYRQAALTLRRYLSHFAEYWIRPLPIVRPKRSAALLFQFLSEWRRYASLPGAERLRFLDSYPQLRDRTQTTRFDAHYFYQAAWATRRIHESAVSHHVDIGSDKMYVGILTALTKVTFVDIRPLTTDLDDYQALDGSILALPFADDSLTSLSSLHVIEHIGLGRYGDTLDPLGSREAASELVRVLAPGGNLYVSMPIGRPRVMFNAHRVHSPQEVAMMFAGLALVSFCGSDDRGRFLTNIEPTAFADARYACGCYHFTKLRPSV